MQKFNLLIEKLGGRKFFLVLFVFLVSSFLLWLPQYTSIVTINKDDFLSLSKVLLLAYPLANIGQSLVFNSFPPGDEPSAAEDMVGGRKYTLILLMYSFFVLFTLSGLITASMYVEFTQWLVGVYFTGNIAGKAIDNGMSVSLGKK